MDTKTGIIPGLYEFDWTYGHPIVFSVEIYDFDPGILYTSDEVTPTLYLSTLLKMMLPLRKNKLTLNFILTVPGPVNF